MKVSEQLAIIKAYINKIPIEVKHRLSTNKWKDLIYTNDYYFNFYEYEYRIKEEPEHRPYSSFGVSSLDVECDLQDLLMRFPIKSDKLTINRGVNLLYSVYKNKWLCGYLGDEELDGYGDTPLEAVYNCFVNCVKCKVIS